MEKGNKSPNRIWKVNWNWQKKKKSFLRSRCKIAIKNFENALAPLCAPIQCRSISIKGNAVQCWIDLWCSEVKRTGWQKKGRVLLLKIMPLFCYFRRITIGSSPFWEWSKSQQALAEALGPILTKIVQKLSLLSFKNVIIVTILKRHILTSCKTWNYVWYAGIKLKLRFDLEVCLRSLYLSQKLTCHTV